MVKKGRVSANYYYWRVCFVLSECASCPSTWNGGLELTQKLKQTWNSEVKIIGGWTPNPRQIGPLSLLSHAYAAIAL